MRLLHSLLSTDFYRRFLDVLPFHGRCINGIFNQAFPCSLDLGLDPSDNNNVTTELDLGPFLKEQLKDRIGTDWDHIVVAYNDMEWVTDPKTNERLLLMGLGVNEFNSDSTWYLVRHSDGTYTVHEIPYIFDFRGQPRALYGTRTIRVSPFAQDDGQVLYFGGFDCGFKKSHNTAWIYSADIGTVQGE